MKRNALLILSLLVTFAAWANPRSWQQAKAIAQQQAAQIGITLSPSSIANAKPSGQTTQTDATYYVFANDKDKGYVIVSGDDQMPDIVGYSASATYPADNLPPAFAAMLQDYDSLVKAVQSGDRQALSIVEEAKALRAEKTSVAVEPLLGDIRWSQRTPYNNKCPQYDENGSLCVTGCVATAMAQVMAYYKYPSQLLADIPEYTTITNKIKMPAIPKGTTFDWNNMLHEYKNAEYTAEQADAVATLMLVCGCAVEMDYGKSSSSNIHCYELSNYFGYDDDLMQELSRDNFTLKQWTDIIDQELQAKRPVLYAGRDPKIGHQFVCDGADGKGLYHINWGWGGSYDNYVDMTIICTGKNYQDNPDGYSRKNRMIIGVAPDNGVVDKPLVTITPIFAVEHDPLPIAWTKSERANEKEKFEGVLSVAFVSYVDFYGSVAIGVKKSDGTYDILAQTKPDSIKEYDSSELDSIHFSYAFPVGNTQLYHLYSTDGKTWEPCGTNDFISILVTATETEIKTDTMPIKVDLRSGGREMKVNESEYFSFKITNNLSEEYNGLFYISMKKKNKDDEDDDKSYNMGSMYMSIPGGSTVTKDPELTAEIAGDMTMYIEDIYNHVFGEWDITVVGDATAISAPVSAAQSACSIIGGKGSITVKVSEAKTIAVYNANGQKAAELSIKGGEQKTISLQPGVYIVDKTKVVVR